jgi:hypothetical protein
MALKQPRGFVGQVRGVSHHGQENELSTNRPDTLTQTFFIHQLFPCSQTADHTFDQVRFRPSRRPKAKLVKTPSSRNFERACILKTMKTSDFRWPFLIVLASIPIVGNLVEPTSLGVSAEWSDGRYRIAGGTAVWAMRTQL